MKIVAWFLVLILFIFDIFCNDNILSKLHQHSYRIKDFRMELMSYNEKFFNFMEIKTFKYNRTTPAVNFTANMKISVKDKIEVVIQAYKFLSNEYRHFPIRCQINLKRAFDSNALGFQNVKNCGNVTDIYIEKDVTYHFCNFVLDETHFPPLVPSGRYRMEGQWTYLDEEIAVILVFNEIYTPFPYPKN